MMIYSLCLLFLLITLFSAAGAASTQLSPGDLHIVAYASDDPDIFAFVSWIPIAQGTALFFTDRGWACNGFMQGYIANEGGGGSVIRYTAPHDLEAGAVQVYEHGVSSSPDWVVEQGSVLQSVYGDQLIVYQGTLEEPTPIYAFDTTGGWEECGAIGAASDSQLSALPDGLVDGESAVSFDHKDNFWYRPWYAQSATLSTLKQWMVNRDRFLGYNTETFQVEDIPTAFTILDGEIGASGYTEYIPGTAPCLILTGHDGDLYPESLLDRNHGCLVDGSSDQCDWSKNCGTPDADACRAVTLNDENTQDMARRAVDVFETFTGGRCHLVVNRLARIKLDPNREIEQAAQFDDTAIAAYNEFHDFATQARNEITTSCGKGLVIDFHGHTHPEARIELGYKLSATNLRETDAVLDGLAYTSSIKNLPTHTTASFSRIVRGENSMGALFELGTATNSSGYLSIPSPSEPYPKQGESYFQGGYNIETHGSQDGGVIDAIQIEFPRYLRAAFWDIQEDVLAAFGQVVLPEYLKTQYLFSNPGSCISNPMVLEGDQLGTGQIDVSKYYGVYDVTEDETLVWAL